MDHLIDIGQQLKSYRQANNLTQADIAKQASIHRQIVSDIERGKFTGSISTLLKYLDLANLELTCTPKKSEFPQLDELDKLFGGDE
ncbi:helix-turn-helix domain-containing protein [Dasania marina]|uniref:helix-turn-helix transcriptional regulator n=1 Tax=Dasania marina TaxID=471499 RepID=UPI0030DCBBBA|tara:strand:- start:5061 stop:5318 length:258 start_codon:yes stop_codon:yes gene_type:complete